MGMEKISTYDVNCTFSGLCTVTLLQLCQTYVSYHCGGSELTSLSQLFLHNF